MRSRVQSERTAYRKKHERTTGALKKAGAGYLSFINKTHINCGVKVKQYISKYRLFLVC
jgi:hypothetical protein